MLNSFKKTNIKIAIAVIVISVFGIIMQYSASSYNALKETGDAFFYVKKQGISMIVALIAMFSATFIKTEVYYKFRYLILGFSLLILSLVFIPGLGIEKYGAKRWINLGFFTLQPSEVSKFGLMIFIASNFSKKSAITFKSMIPVFLATLLMCGLIMLQPNMSITMLIGMSMIAMLFVGGAKFKHFLILAIPVIIAIPILIAIEPYRMKRIIAFLDPWSSPQNEGFQLIQSFYALSSGGIFGVGLFNSRQKYSFLPFAESDFIFAIIGEELGLFGCVLTIALLLFIVYQGIKTAMRATDRFNTYLASGITIIIALQSVLNIAVVTGSIPPTGLPLPFISSGGTSLVVFMFAIGILMRINNQSSLHNYH